MITEIGPNSLSLLFNKSPSTSSDEEADKIVDVLRKQRVDFKMEEKGSKKVAASPEMTLDDLGL